jgi:iron complex outermembrane recepter protein
MNVPNLALRMAVRAVLMTAPGLAATTAYAQQAQGGSQQSADQLQDMVVYGQAVHYRPDDQSVATGLQMQIIDAPVSVSVMTDQMLKQANARTLYEVADLVPGLNQAGEGYGEVDLRLRGQNVTQPRVDGINYGTTQFVDSFALDRVEIVRGPATVLYGVTGAFGGELNQVLKQPKSEFTADVGYRDGNFTGRRWEADVTGAVPGTDDRLKVRVLGAYTDYSIFQDIVIPPHNINKMIAGAVSFDFTPATVVSLNGYKEDRHYDATDGCAVAVNPSTGQLYLPTSIPVEQFYCGDPKQNHAATADEFSMASVKHKFDNGWYTNANVAYGLANRDLHYVFAFGPAGANGLPPQDVSLYSYLEHIDITTLTANASLGGKFDLFERTHEFFSAVEYQKEDNTKVTYQSFALGLMNMFRDGGKGILADGTPIPVIPTPTSHNTQASDTKEVRASAQVLLNPAERWDVLIGALVQHTSEDESVVYTNGTANTHASLTETDVVKRLGVTYGLLAQKGTILSDAKTYASYAEGFQPNVGVYDAVGTPLTAPQRMKSYEIGLKTQWIDSHVDADIALYHATRTNIPASVITSVGTAGQFHSILGGKNTYDGMEFDLLGEVLPGWNVSLNYTFTRNRQQSLLFPQPLEVANVPKHDVGLLNSYEFLRGPLKGLVLGATVVRKIDVPLVDAAQTLYSGGYNPSNQLFESVTIWNFRALYKGFGGPLHGLEIYANANNAFNARFIYSINGDPGFTTTVMAPRALSAGVNYHF